VCSAPCSARASTSCKFSKGPLQSVLADENRINLRLLAPPRGRIYDRFGVALADNKHNYRVVVVPEQAGDLEGDR